MSISYHISRNSHGYYFQLSQCKRAHRDTSKARSSSPVTRDSDTRLRNNISRAKCNLKRLALNNDWEYFFTGTLDKAKVSSRYDKARISKSVRTALNHFRSRYAPDFRYLLVFEPHEDGAVHFHCLCSGIPSSQLVDSGHRNKYGVIYNFIYFRKNFGHTTVIKCNHDYARTANYISKYVIKSFYNSEFYKSGEHLFIHSQGLSSGVIFASSCGSDSFIPTFSNDYVTRRDISSIDELRDLISSGEVRCDFLSHFVSLSDDERIKLLSESSRATSSRER